MRCDCHMHMILDGFDWRAAIRRHSEAPDEAWIREILQTYRDLGFRYLRDGGDRWGAGKKAREIAPEYGIRYRTPLAPLCKRGHYGGVLGSTYENMREYAALGDNTTNSLDSRYWGPVKQFNIIGPASFALWPFTAHWGNIE